MHETALVRNLIHKLEKLCADEEAERVVEVAVWLGALCHMAPEHFTDHFRQEAAGTCADQAHLKIETSDDINHPNAQDVLLQSLELETGPGAEKETGMEKGAEKGEQKDESADP